jgi:hypothetical protein
MVDEGVITLGRPALSRKMCRVFEATENDGCTDCRLDGRLANSSGCALKHSGIEGEGDS